MDSVWLAAMGYRYVPITLAWNGYSGAVGRYSGVAPNADACEWQLIA